VTFLCEFCMIAVLQVWIRFVRGWGGLTSVAKVTRDCPVHKPVPAHVNAVSTRGARWLKCVRVSIRSRTSLCYPEVGALHVAQSIAAYEKIHTSLSSRPWITVNTSSLSECTMHTGTLLPAAEKVARHLVVCSTEEVVHHSSTADAQAWPG
jgi:hypothetical protein